MNDVKWFFFDTSSIVKRYHGEEGTEIVNKIFDAIKNRKARGIISFLSVSEFFSALRRKVNTREITLEQLKDAIATFLDESRRNLRIEPIESTIFADGLNFILGYSLKSADSALLATMSKIAEETEIERSNFYLLSSDEELLKAAKQEGFQTIDPAKVKAREIDRMLGE